MLKYLYIIVAIFFFFGTAESQVIINEVVSSNENGPIDIFGKKSDWIELYNTTTDDINLKSYTISNNFDDLYKWTFPEVVIPAQGFLLIFCSGKDIPNPQELHTNFKLSQSGEELFLTRPDGYLTSQIEFGFIPTNHSLAYVGDSHNSYFICNQPTPGLDNNESTGLFYSHPSGYYNDGFDLEFYSPISEATIRYTLNASNPDLTSHLYENPLSLQNISNEPFSFSSIPTTPLSGAPYFEEWIWKEPQSVYMANVIRAEVFKDDIAIGNLVSLVYFIDPEMKKRYRFPVVSIITDSLNLFSADSGIYVPGALYGQIPFDYWPVGNFTMRGKEWEREMYINYFEAGGKPIFETKGGMRIRGFGSAGFSQKSLNIYFRKEYGLNKIGKKLFPNSMVSEFKRLIFRNGGNDFPDAHIKDVFLSQTIKDFNVEIQEYEPIVVFINGEYWGIHNMREKMDKRHFSYKYDIPKDEINILGVCGSIDSGSDADYQELIDYIRTHDLSTEEAYNHVSQRLDIESTIDYNIAEIYFANYDWPCNNYKMWKSNTPDDKWKYVIYDLDFTFGYNDLSTYETNSLEHATKVGDDWPYCECASVILRNLLKNKVFVEQFLDRFQFHLENAFKPENFNKILDQIFLEYQPEIEEHILRFGFPESLDKWNSHIDSFRVFIRERPCIMRQHIIDFFELKNWKYICPTSHDISNRENEEDWIVFPNPSNGSFHILCKQTSVTHVDLIEIFDNTGRRVYLNRGGELDANNSHFVELPHLSDGIYLLRITSGSSVHVSKIMIQDQF